MSFRPGDLPDPALARELSDYLATGRPPGRLLGALLRNDLRGAVAAGGGRNIADWILFFEKALPVACWGSPAIVRQWRGSLAQPAGGAGG